MRGSMDPVDGPRRKRRRVTAVEPERKRAELSCDLCRKLRCKCVREDGEEPCQACRQRNVRCESTYRKKTRVYGSLETITARYLCLDAIIKNVFPDEPTRTVEDLLALARKRGYEMPEASVTDGEQTDLQTNNNSRNDSRPSLPSSRGLGENAGGLHTSIMIDRPDQLRDASRLVRDLAGRTHYIGPSGSLSFFADLRDLISKRQPTSEFASDNVVKALEGDHDGNDSSDQTFHDHSHGPTPQSPSAETSITTSGLNQSLSQLRRYSLEEIDKLVDVFFESVEKDFPLFHRATFQEVYERTFVESRSKKGHSGTETEQEPDDGWIVAFHMMLAFGCFLLTKRTGSQRSTTSIDYESLRLDCLNISRGSLVRLSTTCTQSNVQALLLLALYYHTCNERNASWTLVGTAVRVAVAIGLHRNDLNGAFRPIERETRKRIWCTLYTIEQFLCMSLGRPSAIDDLEVNVAVPSDDLMSSSNGPPSYAEHFFKLQLLSSWIRRAMSTQTKPTQRLVPAARPRPIPTDENRGFVPFLAELKEWESNLPPYLLLPDLSLDEGQVAMQLQMLQSRYSSHHFRAVVLLHLQYHNLIILNTRPYLLMTITASASHSSSQVYPWYTSKAQKSSTAGSTDPIDLARTCVSSASHVAKLIILLEESKLWNGLTGLDIFYAYSAAMVLLLRILGDLGPSSTAQAITTETRLKGEAQGLVERLRRVLRNIDKCLTMERFASVVNNFAEAVRASSVTSRGNNAVQPPDTVRIDNSNEPNSNLQDIPHGFQYATERPQQYYEGNTQVAEQDLEPSQRLGALNFTPPDAGRTTWTPQRAHVDPVNIMQPMYQPPPPTYGPIYGDNISMPQAENHQIQYPDMVPGFSNETMSPGSLMWHDPWEVVTQHVVDWNDFERFLGTHDI